MVCVRQPESEIDTPFSDLAAGLVARRYIEIGCDRWNARKVMLLCAKFGDTQKIMCARLRLRPAEFQRRMETDSWTKQDGLILTLLEREIDMLRGGGEAQTVLPEGDTQ